MENKKLYDERLKRINDAIALKEPDRVPCIPFAQTYPYTNVGYTMSEVMYDTSKAQDGMRKFLTEYEPDMALGYAGIFAGMTSAFPGGQIPNFIRFIRMDYKKIYAQGFYSCPAFSKYQLQG